VLLTLSPGTALRSRFFLALGAALLLATPLAAHLTRYDIRVELTPPQTAGVVVELHQDALAPQLVIENRSGKLLEILDAEGRAFLRIGAREAEADVATAAFHHSRISGGAAPPAGTLSKTPRWRTVNREPSYGWFDPRIAIEQLEIPYAIKVTGQSTGQALPFAEWQIPARLGGEPMTLHGRFVHTPPPRGTVQTRLLIPAELTPGVHVELATGETPAILLRNSGTQPVSVLDSRGKPFLRITADGTYARPDSPDWPAANTGRTVSGSGWQRVSASRTLVWLEPRARYAGPPPANSSNSRLGDWSVPILVGKQRLELRGTHEWIPAPENPGPAAANK